jgi:CHAT domain-containing protein
LGNVPVLHIILEEMEVPVLRVLAAVLISCVSLRGEVIRVPRDYASIKSAVFAAVDGDVIDVDDGYYLEGNIILDKAVTLRARHPFRAVIYGDVGSGFTDAIFIIRAPAAIEGFVLKNGLRGILQRGSPDAAWKAERLAIMNMMEEAVSINATEGNIGQGTIRGVIIDNCEAGFMTNDAHSMDVSECLVANCKRAFSGYNHLRFRVENTSVWNCEHVFREAEERLPRPCSNTITLGVNVEVIDAGSARRRLTMSSAENFPLIPGWLFNESSRERIARGFAMAIAGDVHLRRGDVSQSVHFYQAAKKLGEEAAFEELTWRALAGLASAEEKLVEYPAALEHYRKVISLLEDLREMLPMRIFNPGFLQDKVPAFISFIRFLHEMHKRQPLRAYLEEALACAERSRARGFLDSLEESGLDFATGVSPVILREGKRLSEAVSRYQLRLTSGDFSPAKRSELLGELEVVENAYRDLMIRIRRDIPTFPGRHYPGPLGYEEIRAKLLPPGTGLVEFVLGDTCSFAFWVTRDSLSLARLPPAGEILPLVQRYLKFLTLKSPNRFLAGEGSSRLFDMLLGPFREELAKKIKRIIVVPDGYLNYLPFESLMFGDEGNGRGRRFLVEDFEICYAPSASVLARLAERERDSDPRKDLVAISVPEVPSRTNCLFGYPIELSKLEHAYEEVEAIGRGFTEDDRAILEGPEAAEGRLKQFPLNEFRYIHFVVHGIFDDRSWRRSGLLLWREKESVEDGILQLRDIYLLDLHSDLVVLSACQSGKGNMSTGEGINGLAEGFLFAGSRAVLVSQWNIDDRSTAVFMGLFYEYLREGKSAAQALQAAKIAMIRSAFHRPFYWAAFVLIGDIPSYSISK